MDEGGEWARMAASSMACLRHLKATNGFDVEHPDTPCSSKPLPVFLLQLP